jgi:hypothetical protein
MGASRNVAQLWGLVFAQQQNFTPQSSTPHILATKTLASILRTLFDSQLDCLQNSFLQFPFHARGSVAQCCATIGTGVRATTGPAANQRRATTTIVPKVAGVYTELTRT